MKKTIQQIKYLSSHHLVSEEKTPWGVKKTYQRGISTKLPFLARLEQFLRRIGMLSCSKYTRNYF